MPMSGSNRPWCQRVKRAIRRATCLGRCCSALGVVALLYLAIQLVATAAVPDLATSTTPLLDAAAVLLGPVGAIILMLGVLASVGGNLLGAMFSSPRISYALALDGLLPRWFAAVHPRFLTPANSIVVVRRRVVPAGGLGTFIFLAATATLWRLLMYILVCAAVPRLRARLSPRGGFVLPGGQLVPILAIAASISLLIGVRPRIAAGNGGVRAGR